MRWMGRVIDVHAHAVLEVSLGAAGPAGPEAGTQPDGRPFYRIGDYVLTGVRYAGTPFMDVDVRLAAMDAAGIDVQLLSPNPLTYFERLDAADATAYARTHNDALAALGAKHPGWRAAARGPAAGPGRRGVGGRGPPGSTRPGPGRGLHRHRPGWADAGRPGPRPAVRGRDRAGRAAVRAPVPARRGRPAGRPAAAPLRPRPGLRVRPGRDAGRGRAGVRRGAGPAPRARRLRLPRRGRGGVPGRAAVPGGAGTGLGQ